MVRGANPSYLHYRPNWCTTKTAQGRLSIILVGIGTINVNDISRKFNKIKTFHFILAETT